MQDWTDLRFFLSVARSGSTLAASAGLKTSQSTVFRRIGALEKALSMTLFDRRPSGYSLTSAGSRLLPLAQQVEAAIDALTQAAAAESRQQMTVIRLSLPDASMEYMLPAVMPEFRDLHPDVRIEIVASDRKLDLASGEADVALRANPASDPDLFGRRLTSERPTLTAGVNYAQHHKLPTTDTEVADHAFISLTSVYAGLLGDWFARTVPRHRVLLQPDSITSTVSAVRSGLGIAVLPQFLSDRDPTLVAAPLELPITPFELWIVTHERMRAAPAVRALMDCIARYVTTTSSTP